MRQTATHRTELQRFADRMGVLADASEERSAAIRARIAARNQRGNYTVTCSCTTCGNAAPILRPAFVLRAAILLAIGAASASGVGSILGCILGAL